jgi:hypothetical protein
MFVFFKVMEFIGDVLAYFREVMLVDCDFCKHNYSSIMDEIKNEGILNF